jgi:hypothetical protein
VVSVAPEVRTSCSIVRGTHPEQHLVCSSDELSGLSIRGAFGGLEITGIPADVTLQTVNYQVLMDSS